MNDNDLMRKQKMLMNLDTQQRADVVTAIGALLLAVGWVSTAILAVAPVALLDPPQPI